MARSKILLDEVMPVYEFSDAQSILIHASPQQIWRAFNAITLAEIPVMRPLFWLRTLPARLSGTRPVELPETQPFNELALGPESPWILLAEQPEHELVMGAIDIFAQLKIEFVPIRDVEEFTHFTNPKYSKTVLGFRIADGESATSHVVTMESRTQVPDPSMRRRFAIYWMLIQPFEALMVREALRAIKRRAEGAEIEQPVGRRRLLLLGGLVLVLVAGWLVWQRTVKRG